MISCFTHRLNRPPLGHSYNNQLRQERYRVGMLKSNNNQFLFESAFQTFT